MSHKPRIRLLNFCLLLIVAVGWPRPAAADMNVGTAVSITVPGLGALDANVEGFNVFRDVQGSYYLKKGDQIIKPQQGDGIGYRDTNNLAQSVVQPAENLTPTTEQARQYVIESFFDVFTALTLEAGDKVYPAPMPQALKDQYLELDPPAFGDNPISDVRIWALDTTPARISLFGSTNADGSSPQVFSLDIGTQWLEMSVDGAVGVAQLTVISGNIVPETEMNDVLLVATIPAPSAAILGWLGIACLTARRRNRAAGQTVHKSLLPPEKSQ